MKIYNHILNRFSSGQKSFALLIDSDKISFDYIEEQMAACREARVDFIFIGGSLLIEAQFHKIISEIKRHARDIPVILFPGGLNQVSNEADALLYLSLISGRNPEYLISNQVLSAPTIKKLGIEAISTAYMLIESGQTTSVEFISNTKPLPRNKPEIVVAHAMAAELLGFKMIYLEAGSGALNSVPNEIISYVKKSVTIPVIVGGGIKSANTAQEIAKAGADIIVVGNHFETTNSINQLLHFSESIHI